MLIVVLRFLYSLQIEVITVCALSQYTTKTLREIESVNEVITQGQKGNLTGHRVPE